MTDRNQYPIFYLVVDENLADRQLTIETLEQSEPHVGIREAANADEVVHTINDVASLGVDDTHVVVIADPGPHRDAIRRIVQSVRQHPSLGGSPIIAWSTVDEQTHIQQAYVDGVNCYFIKPTTIEEYRQALTAVVRFWRDVACLPVTTAAQPLIPQI